MTKLSSFGFNGGGSSSSGGSSVAHEDFIATAGQTDFICTTITLTANCIVFVNGSKLQTGEFTRSVNTIILPPQMELTPVTVTK